MQSWGKFQSNQITKVTNSFGKIYHCLWNKMGINLGTKIQIYKAVILSSLLYVRILDTILITLMSLIFSTKGCLQTICGHNLGDKILNAKLFIKCTETFLIQLQLRWAGQVNYIPCFHQFRLHS